MRSCLLARTVRLFLSLPVGLLRYGLAFLRSRILNTMSLLRRRRNTEEWRLFENEIIEATGGRRIKVYRKGRYADIRTDVLLIEAKWSDTRCRISAPMVLDLRELAYRHNLYPLLAAGTHGIRVACLCGQERSEEVDRQVRRLLDYWWNKGYDVWVVPVLEDYPGEVGVVPTTALIGKKYEMLVGGYVGS